MYLKQNNIFKPVNTFGYIHKQHCSVYQLMIQLNINQIKLIREQI